MKKLSVILLTLVLAAAWTSAALADFTTYGSVRLATFYIDADEADTQNLEFDLQGNSRLGTKFAKGDVKGHIELGLNDDSGATDDDAKDATVYLRHVYGSYDFGPGVVLVGQTTLPYTFYADNKSKGDLDMIGQGALHGREPQLRLALKSGFYAALIENDLQDSDDDIDFPELAVGYNGTVNNFAYGVHAAYVAVDNAADVTGYFVAANTIVDLGGAKIFARAYYGQNLAAFGLAEGYAVLSDDEDADCYGAWIMGQMKASDKVKVQAGFGWGSVDADDLGDGDTFVYFINAPITVAKGFTVSPEIAYYDNEDTIAGGDKELYVGAQWRMDF